MSTPLPEYDIQKIFVEASTRCNYRCRFCSNMDERVTRADMSPEMFTAVIENIAAARALPPVLALSQKGEPFMNRRLHELVALAKDRFGFRYVYLSTNGSLCTPDRARPLVEAGIDSIKFSINALEREPYAEIHGVDGLDKVLDNMRRLLELKMETGGRLKVFASTVSTKSQEEVEAAVRAAVGEQAAHLDGVWRYPEYYTPRNAGRELVLPPDHETCPMPFLNICVDANGELTACCRDYFGQLRYGNLLEVPFAEAWHDRRFEKLRKMLAERTLPKAHMCYECLAVRHARKKEPFVWDVAKRPGPEQRSTLDIPAPDAKD
ncbi:MAG: radical SAM/SPASM domain-containing protein [Desulfovibrionaceae bacterium]